MSAKNLDNLPLVDFRPLSETTQREAFSCGDNDIDTWFLKRCSQDHARYQTRVQTAHNKNTDKMVGFYCLSISLQDETLLENSRKTLVRAKNRQFVSLNLDILAIKSEYQGNGYGTRLLAQSIEDFNSLIQLTGLRAMTLVCSANVKPSFYESFGFVRYGRPSSAPMMLLPAQSVQAGYAEVIQTENNA